KSSIVIIVVELVWLGVVCDEEIEPAIRVVVEQGYTESFAGRIVETCFLRYVLKCSITAIVKKSRTLTFVALRCTVRFVLIVERAIDVGLNPPVDVVAYKKIELAIVVIVEPNGTRRKTRISHASSCCHIRELAAAKITKQMVGSNTGYVDVVISIVVVIGNCD